MTTPRAVPVSLQTRAALALVATAAIALALLAGPATAGAAPGPSVLTLRTVKVGGVAANFRVVSDSKIDFTVPASVKPGLRHVGVTSPAGISAAKGPAIMITS